MTSVDQYSFAPGAGEVVLSAYSRLGIRGPALLAEHMYMSRMELNLMFAQWANDGPGLFNVDLLTIPLAPGITTYPLDDTTIATLDVYITDTGQADRILMPIGRSEWSSYPNKSMLGFPSVYWYDRLISPFITIWPSPYPYFSGSLKIYRWCQNKTADISGGNTLTIPYRFLDAATAGLAHRLSRHYAPALEQLRGADAAMAWKNASVQDTEKVPMYIGIASSSYWRS